MMHRTDSIRELMFMENSNCPKLRMKLELQTDEQLHESYMTRLAIEIAHEIAADVLRKYTIGDDDADVMYEELVALGIEVLENKRGAYPETGDDDRCPLAFQIADTAFRKKFPDAPLEPSFQPSNTL